MVATRKFGVGGEGMLPIEVAAVLAGTTVAGDGVTDDSAAVVTTHNWAASNGIRELYCAKQYNAAAAWNIGLVIFRGPGQMIGTYRKKIVPFSARAFAPTSGVNPKVHLRRFSKALNPVVVIWGDSTGTPTGANHISLTEMLGTMLERSLNRCNPGRTINWVNRSIGGSTIQNFNQTGTVLIAAGLSPPSWFSPTSAPWSGFVSNQSPDLVIINWEANTSSINQSIANIDAVVQFLRGLAKVPDILFATGLPRGTQTDVGSATVAALEARDYAASALRSYAEFDGTIGVIDTHRFGCMARDGFDPCSQIMTQNVTAGTYALPATLPMTQGDFDLTFQIDNTGGAAFGSSQQLDIVLSQNTGNTVRLKSSGSVYQFIGETGGGLFWKTIFTTAVTIPTGLCTIEISVRGSFISIYLETVLVFEGLCQRHPGGQFNPIVQYGIGSGATQISSVSLVTSSPALVQPILTDAEMYGSGSFSQGGNGINHPASPCYEAVHTLFDQVNLTATGRPTQNISAASAINPDASLIEITGPATSTYAVTLAAPRLQDQGNTLAIEMKATTSTNAVTLALTNVTGGTANTTCTWNAAAQKLILLACGTTWEVIKQDGVTLT